MKAVAAACQILVLLYAVASAADAQENAPENIRFEAVDIYVEAAEPLAAWQFELSDPAAAITIVGVENGESAAFERAPYYDLEAVQQGSADRIIVADFSLSPVSLLPIGRTRVATIHVRVMGQAEPNYNLRLIAAGNAEGHSIDAQISLDTQRE